MTLSPTQEAVLAAIGTGWTRYDSADARTVAALARRGLVEERVGHYQARLAPTGKDRLILRLRELRQTIYDHELALADARLQRDELVLELVENHDLTWREAAEFAGFANPYIAYLKRQRSSGPTSDLKDAPEGRGEVTT